jgi:membrane protein
MLRDAAVEWWRDDAPTHAAALSFYTILSLAPLLIVVIAVAGIAFGDDAARGQIVREFDGLLGTLGARLVEDVVANANRAGSGILATALGIGVLLLGATSVFGQLQRALDVVWDVHRQPGRGLRGAIKDRLLSFAMVVGIGFLLLVSLTVSAALAALRAHMDARLPAFPWEVVDVVLSLAVVTMLFALVFKLLPEVPLRWRDVWFGAVATALLFTAGKFLIGLYLGHSSVASAYGAAGSVVVLLIWVYYSAQILLFGAELTKVYAERRGARESASPSTVGLRSTPVAGESMSRFSSS